MAPKKATADSAGSRKSTRETKQTANPTPQMSTATSSKETKAKSKPKATKAKAPAAAKKTSTKRKAGDQDEEEDDEEEEEGQAKVEKKKKAAAPKKKAAAAPKKSKPGLPVSSLPNENQLSAYNFVFTGKLPSLTRDQAAHYATEKGASLSKTVSGSTTHAVLGDDVGEVKMSAIATRGIKTMTENEFLDLVGVDLNVQVEENGGDEDEEDEDEDKDEMEVDGEGEGGEEKKKGGKQAPKKPAGSPKKKFKSVDVSTLEKASVTSLKGLRVLFTGTLDMDRKEAADLAEKAGATISKSVSGTTDLVILGTKCGPKKLEEIEKKGIKTVDEAGFLKLVGKGEGGSGSGGAGDEQGGEDEGQDDEEEGDEE